MSNSAEPVYSDLASDPDLAELVELFVDEMPDRIAVVERALAANDWEALARAAHQMKGSAGSYGFGVVTDSAASLEHAVKGKSPEAQILAKVNELIDVCRRVSFAPKS